METEFARAFAVSLGVEQAAKWRGIVATALWAVFVAVALENCYLTSNAAWLEQHMDFLSLSAMQARHAGSSWAKRLNLYYAYRRRTS